MASNSDADAPYTLGDMLKSKGEDDAVKTDGEQ
jgi:hypothetical protein